VVTASSVPFGVVVGAVVDRVEAVFEVDADDVVVDVGGVVDVDGVVVGEETSEVVSVDVVVVVVVEDVVTVPVEDK